MSSLVGSDSGARGAHIKGQTTGQLKKKGDNLFGPRVFAVVAFVFAVSLSRVVWPQRESPLQATEANLHGGSACALPSYPGTPTDGVLPKKAQKTPKTVHHLHCQVT